MNFVVVIIFEKDFKGHNYAEDNLDIATIAEESSVILLDSLLSEPTIVLLGTVNMLEQGLNRRLD